MGLTAANQCTKGGVWEHLRDEYSRRGFFWWGTIQQFTGGLLTTLDLFHDTDGCDSRGLSSKALTSIFRQRIERQCRRGRLASEQMQLPRADLSGQCRIGKLNTQLAQLAQRKVRS
jgi:hypothetical protein